MTRLYNNVVSGRLIRIKNKTQYLRRNLLSLLCIFLMGFLSGNLFGTVLNNLRNWVRWDGFIIFGLIAKIEAISFFSYKSSNWSCITEGDGVALPKGHQIFWNNFNLFKIGIMVGFFVDAFKVGS